MRKDGDDDTFIKIIMDAEAHGNKMKAIHRPATQDS